MRKKTHEEYVNELNAINADVHVIGKYSRTHTPIMHRCTIHDYEWMASPANILKGKGCPKCRSLKLRSAKSKTHEQYVKEIRQCNKNIVVLERYINNRTNILHQCLVDNHIWSAAPVNILSGSGCPACASRKQSMERTKKHEDYVEEVYAVNSDIDVVEKYAGAETKILHRCKIDGYEWYALPSNILSGHGCPMCNVSIGEREVKYYLINHNISYIYQHTFDDCKNKKALPFDFYLPDYNACIEYDGEQHFRPVEYFGGEDGFMRRQHNDKIKTTYCKLNNITLLRIRYDQYVSSVLDDFFSNTKLIKEAI